MPRIVAVDADRDDHGDRHDATVLAHLHVGRVDPQIRPVSFYGAGEEGFHLLVISSHSLETWLFEIPLIPMALTRSSTERVETPCT
jgi:hypothetical protein